MVEILQRSGALWKMVVYVQFMKVTLCKNHQCGPLRLLAQ